LTVALVSESEMNPLRHDPPSNAQMPTAVRHDPLYAAVPVMAVRHVSDRGAVGTSQTGAAQQLQPHHARNTPQSNEVIHDHQFLGSPVMENDLRAQDNVQSSDPGQCCEHNLAEKEVYL